VDSLVDALSRGLSGNRTPVNSLHPLVLDWFEGRLGNATEPQTRAWPAIRSGEHVLISAPTGSGKTLAAFLICLDDLVRAGLAGGLPDTTVVLYVPPLKALSNDVHKNLDIPLSGIRADKAFKRRNRGPITLDPSNPRGR
jgi:ATP-dependent Lhr-like helicase